MHETPEPIEYVTAGGIGIVRTATPIDESDLTALSACLDQRRGGVLSSGVEYPGRYSRWHLGYVDPPIELVAAGRTLTARALDERGEVLLPLIDRALAHAGDLVEGDSTHVTVHVPPGTATFAEEDRSRQPTIFTALRAIRELFAADRDRHLGLYGAFGYDLALQFEPLRLRQRRPADQRDLVLHLPDRVLVVDRKRETGLRYDYEFTAEGRTTVGLPRLTPPAPAAAAPTRPIPDPPPPGRFADVVDRAKERFRTGDLFEVTPGHVLHGRCGSPAAFYERLRVHNPAPYEFLFNLGAGEHLVAASPEMYVRVSGDRVETCPIAGTVERGADALADAEQIRTLLGSTKDEAELTMCTDVDRNDKSRVCVPGSVEVIGRRQIEVYRRLIHTVDHIEGRLLPGYDAFDAFLTHMWAVTVTGAPKQSAMQFIEDQEDTPRGWYGAAAGFVGFDGSTNTGLTLRAAQIREGIAAVRVGATLLSDSDPDEEEQETYLKAQALFDVLDPPVPGAEDPAVPASVVPASEVEGSAALSLPGQAIRVLVVDFQDSFVLTLADYFRQLGSEVTTMRFGFDESLLDEQRPDLLVLSPGPGTPRDFDCERLLKASETRTIAAFGVCLGLQAMVEYAGGELSVLPDPAHGKPSRVDVTGGDVLTGMEAGFTAARYHSLYARPEQVKTFRVTASTLDVSGETVAMAIEDPERQQWGVQFHPESVLTATGGTGHRVVANVLALCRRRR